jgi:hypothetical protein
VPGTRHHVRLAAGGALTTLITLAAPLSWPGPDPAEAAVGAAPRTAVQAALAPAQLPLGASTTVSGRVEGGAGAAVALELPRIRRARS